MGFHLGPDSIQKALLSVVPSLHRDHRSKILAPSRGGTGRIKDPDGCRFQLRRPSGYDGSVPARS